MKDIKMTKFDWAAPLENKQQKKKLPPTDDEGLDLCMNCQVEGGCDDTDVRCGMVAVRRRYANGKPATQLVKGARYRNKLEQFQREHGNLPFPEQVELIAKG